MRTTSWTLLAMAGAVVLAACSGSADAPVAVTATADDATASEADRLTAPSPSASATSEVSATPRTTAQAAPEDVPANAAALDFTARRLDGGTIDGTQLAGGDVVLWMWAPWCPQCNREASYVAAAVDTWGDRVTFVGIAGHDTDDAHRAFVAEHGLDGILHLVDEDGSLWARYGIDYQPAWVFIDEDGGTERVAGGLYDDLDARLQALVEG